MWQASALEDKELNKEDRHFGRRWATPTAGLVQEDLVAATLVTAAVATTVETEVVTVEVAAVAAKAGRKDRRCPRVRTTQRARGG